jgi:cytochrome c553
VPNAKVPELASMPAFYVIEQLEAFNTGTRAATVMHQLIKGCSDAQIEALAAYVAAQKK